MKKILYNSILAAAVIASSISCSKENFKDASEGKTIDTIQASVANQDEKVSLTQGDGKITLAWESTDKIMVVGNTSEEYSVTSVDGHNATFQGNTVEGSSFDIYYPSSFASAEALMARSYTGQVQNGNGSTAHLSYNAIIKGAEDYHNIVFNREGNNKLNGVLKLVVKMPSEVTEVESISLTAPTAIFYKTNDAAGETTETLSLSFTEGTTVTDNVLTAYIMTSMADVTIPAGTKLVIKVTVPGSGSYFQKTIHDDKNDISLNGGQTLNIDIHDATTMTRKLAGSGTEADPYRIYNKYDMQVVKAHLALKNSTNDATYFTLMNNVDMDGAEWTPIVQAEPFYKINFSSNGAPGTRYTLSNATVTNKKYASIFGVLNGDLHDVNFDNITVNNTTELTAVVSAFLGTSDQSQEGHISNVTVSNSTASQVYSTAFESGTRVGAGIICGNFARGTIDSVTVKNTCTVSQNVTTEISTGYYALGGVAGFEWQNVPDGKEYYIKNVICNATVTNASIQSPKDGDTYKKLSSQGGIIGMIANSGAGMTISGCTFGGQIETGTNINNYHFGCIVGLDKSTGLTIDDCHNTANITLTQHYLGGIIGRSVGSGTVIKNCSNSGALASSSTKNFIAGIAGQLNTGASISNCSNTASITGAKYTAGVAGQLNTDASISNCSNTASITGANYTAGVAGEILANSTAQNCSNSGSVTGAQTVGGVIACIRANGIITGCSNAGNVTATGVYLGGVAGYVETKSNISLCKSTGELSGTGNIGGIAGRLMVNSTIEKCFTSGKISSTANNLGGIAGYIDAGTSSSDASEIKNCYSKADITFSAQTAGGIAGELYQWGNVTACYYAGQTLDGSKGRAIGGIVGRANNGGGGSVKVSGQTFSNNVKYVIAWPKIFKSGGTTSQYSSGVIVGYTGTKNNFVSCYRRPDSEVSYTFTANGKTYSAPVDQGSTTSDITSGVGTKYWYPYHGDATTETTVSNTAKAINSEVANAWDTSIWNLSGDYPTLINNPE